MDAEVILHKILWSILWYFSLECFKSLALRGILKKCYVICGCTLFKNLRFLHFESFILFIQFCASHNSSFSFFLLLHPAPNLTVQKKWPGHARDIRCLDGVELNMFLFWLFFFVWLASTRLHFRHNDRRRRSSSWMSFAGCQI